MNNILDHLENSESNKKDRNIELLIGLIFIISSPLIFLLSSTDDIGLFLPRNTFLEMIPEYFRCTTYNNREEICIEPLDISTVIGLYFLGIGIFYISKIKVLVNNIFKFLHLIITIGLMIGFFSTMIEVDIIHWQMIQTENGENAYLIKVYNFYLFLILWIFLQVIFLIFNLRNLLLKLISK